MSMYAMTILGQLQQLTDGQLSIMCHNYRITPGYITPRNRRHIERRLHVALIEESAKQRALDYIAREKDQEYQQDMFARGRGSDLLPPRPKTFTHSSYSPESYNIRHSINVGTMTTPSVHKIGGNRTLWPSPLPYTSRRSYEPQHSKQDTSIIPTFIKKFAKELPLLIWKGLETQLSPFQRFRGGEQSNVSIEEEEEPGTTYRSFIIPEGNSSNQILSQQLHNTYEEQTHTYPYGLDYEELQLHIQGNAYADIETDNDASISDTDGAVRCDSFASLNSSNNEFDEDKRDVEKIPPKETTVRSFFKFAWWRTEASTRDEALPDLLELDHISENEQEIYTLEYLNDEQKDAEQDKELKDIMGRIDLRDDSEDEAVPLPNRQQRIAGCCSAFFRSIYEFLCCDRRGIWNAEKVRCTLFCCGLLVFVGFNFRRLR